MQTIYRCIYCGCEADSPSGTGVDVECCGERGHVNTVLATTDASIEVEDHGDRIEIWQFDPNTGAHMVEIDPPRANELIEILVKVLNHGKVGQH